MMMAQKSLQHLAVSRQSIRPEILPHQLTRGTQLLFGEGKRDLACRGVFQSLDALRLRLNECLEHGCWQPRMRLHQSAAYAGEMHDRKDAGVRKIIAAGGHGIAEQPADIGFASRGEMRRTRRYEAVDLAAFQ